VTDRLQAIAKQLVDDPEQFRRLTGVYDPPQGEKQFIASLVELLNREYDWGLTPENVALTNGSQSAFFMLFNMLAGEHPDGSHKHILLPLAPEYIGYGDAGLSLACSVPCARRLMNSEIVSSSTGWTSPG